MLKQFRECGEQECPSFLPQARRRDVEIILEWCEPWYNDVTIQEKTRLGCQYVFYPTEKARKDHECSTFR